MNMKFFKKLDLTSIKVLKIAGLVFVVLVILAISFRLIGSSISSVFNKNVFDQSVMQGSSAYDTDGGYFGEEMASGGMNSVSLSARNVGTA